MEMRRLACLLVAACGSTPPRPAPPVAPADPFLVTHEHWETIETQRLAYGDRCGVGPFEVSVPDRDDADPRFAYGRRMVLVIYGPRTLDVDNRIDSKVVQTAINVSGEETEAEHLECRAGAAGDVPVATATVPAGRTGSTSPSPGKEPEKHWYAALKAPSDQLPRLVPYTGARLPPRRQAGAIAFYPKGDPYYYAMEPFQVQNIDHTKATARVSLRFWMRRPSNLDGMVFEVLEQRLVPDADTPAYAAEFAERVARRTQRNKDEQPANQKKWEAHAQHCKDAPAAQDCAGWNRTSMRIPPAPLAEVRPPQPRGDVLWVPGYWSWDDALDDFLWIAGTYIVRQPPRPPEVVAVAPAVVVAPPVVVEPPHEIDAAITEAPAPKVEELPPPPPVPQPNTVWVAGHWELVGPVWRWTRGAWVAGPAGTRYRAPVVHRRGAIRIYVPGGWHRSR